MPSNSNGSGGLVIRPVSQLVAMFSRMNQRLFDPPKDTIRGIDADTWYSPLQPVQPIAPEGTQPRGFQYWAGQNLLWTPRADAGYSAADLKELATYPLASICISNVKDSLCRASWEIQARRQFGETKKQAQARAGDDDDIKNILIKLNKFFEYPDREHNWSEWLREMLDDMLVIDAASILILKTFKNEIAELRVIRGESIVRYVDANGFTPLAPDPAYAQNWWGIPLVNLSTDQLIYKPRNIVPRNTVSSQLYGMSPTEQLADELKIGIQRLAFQLAYYTEGSIPGVVQVVPRGTTPDQISAAMNWMNSELAGNLAARRQWRMVQGFNEPGHPDQIEFTKEPLLTDPFDDMHLRKIAFGYGTSPQRLAKQMNRASAEQADDASEIEGMLPYFVWLKGIIDLIIQRKFGYTDFEWVANPFSESDPEKEATRITTLVSKAILTPNEGRAVIGEEPRDEPEADMLGIVTGTGFVPLGLVAAQAGAELDGSGNLSVNPPEPKEVPGGAAGSQSEGKGPSVAGGKKPGKPGAAKKPPAKSAPAHCTKHDRYRGGCSGCIDAFQKSRQAPPQPIEVRKAAKHVIHPGKSHPNAILARHQIERVMSNAFGDMKRKTLRELRKGMNKIADGIQLNKAKGRDDTLEAILKALAGEWRDLGDNIEKPLYDAILAGTNIGAMQLDLTGEDLLNEINRIASAWAADRAAELVGMKRVGGKLVVNPNAEMAISDTTRDKLKTVISNIFEEETTMTDAERMIEETGMFGRARAEMIARTEIARAQSQGNLTAWKESGLVKSVDWQLSADHDQDDECDENADEGPYDIDDVPDHPAHPNCMCALVINEIAEEE